MPACANAMLSAPTRGTQTQPCTVHASTQNPDTLQPCARQDFTLGDINPAAQDFNQGNGPAPEEAAEANGAVEEPPAASSSAAQARWRNSMPLAFGGPFLSLHPCVQSTGHRRLPVAMRRADFSWRILEHVSSLHGPAGPCCFNIFLPSSLTQMSAMVPQGGSPTGSAQPGSARKQPSSARSAKAAAAAAAELKVVPEVTWQPSRITSDLALARCSLATCSLCLS